ncbi:hypothetical protein BDV06DRAFT_112929 [Aspergillus oleicola]
MPESDSSSVEPAQLSYLAIYNPLLGTTDETIKEQIVFYTSRSSILRRKDSSATSDDKEPSDEWNGRLRQVGLAQGMVTFARNFSEGKAVDYVETEKSQIVLHELEENWWILASVDLTRLPGNPDNGSSRKDASEPSFHYSSREMTPPSLLIQQLRRAHSIFLLHHAPNLDTLYKSAGRSTFCLFLENFWLRYAWNWEVLLGGNPAVEIYNGIKLSAGGELGVGVGEEEWGSGEREVLEDFISRTDGLVDLVVSRFGDPLDSSEDFQAANKPEGDAESRWLGSDAYPRPSDGVIFSGVGSITRRSVVSISQWMEWIYRYGADAYGVGTDPTSPRRRKRRKRQRATTSGSQSTSADAAQRSVPDRTFSPGIPQPLVTTAPSDSQEKDTSQTSNESSQEANSQSGDWIMAGTETFVKYLTLGYGSAWSLSRSPSRTSSPHPQAEASQIEGPPTEASNSSTQRPKGASISKAGPRNQNYGRFIIGLQDGTAGSETVLEETEPSDPAATSTEKIAKRVVHVQMADPQQDTTGAVQLQAVVYVVSLVPEKRLNENSHLQCQPFVYTFLFEMTTPSLSEPSLYHSIHHQLGPLQKPLSTSTSPSTEAFRVSETPETKSKSHQHHPIYDLVYDPHNLSIRSSIPNIPDLISHHQSLRLPTTATLSRVETISIHHRLLTTYVETRSRPLELERTCKTSRGWWIVWVRVYAPPHDQQEHSEPEPDRNKDKQQQEAFIIRQASDHVGASSGHARNSSSIGGVSSGARFFRDLGGASSPGLPQSSRMDLAPGKLVEGLGLDARRYIENLLSLNR